ncbi:hypothetical protein FMUAM8_47440 [Nocardia cyriacigeorgica]|nr:hypothetical protein FMUAM8_47440 [Nocardia cyriacigeorgica]BDU08395.1 hypothetical protein FMUBM48_46580 [Nocardia cyriacigeorgica]
MQFLGRQLLEIVVTGHNATLIRARRVGTYVADLGPSNFAAAARRDRHARRRVTPKCSLTSSDSSRRRRVNDEFTDTPVVPRARTRAQPVASWMRVASLWLAREVLTVTEPFSTRGPAPGPRGI